VVRRDDGSPQEQLTRPRERGVALIVALVVMIMVIAISATMLLSVVVETRAVGAGRDRMQAFYVAEAGFHIALTKVRSDTSLSSAAAVAAAATIPSSSATVIGGGSWETSATVTADGAHIVLTSVGRVGGERRAIEGVVDAGFDLPVSMPYACHAGTVDLRRRTVVDSYRSSDGALSSAFFTSSHPPSAVNQRGDISYDAEGAAHSQTVLRGYVHVPPGITSIYPWIGSGTVSLDDAVRRRPLRRPSAPSAGTSDISLSGNQTQTIGPGPAQYDDVSLDNSSVLTIVGPGTVVLDNVELERDSKIIISGSATVIVDGDIDMEDDSTIHFDARDGRVALYAGGSFGMGSGDPGARITSEVALPQDANIWLLADRSYTLRPSRFFGTIYAGSPTGTPRVSIATSTSSTAPQYCMAGALAAVGSAGTVLVGQSSRLAYDEDLASASIPAPTIPTYEVLRWRELP
jgi:hypothetical protein